MDKIRVGVVGIGYLGSQHARLYASLPGVALTALCDSDPAKSILVKKYRVPFYTDFRELFGKVDAASIVVPTKDHHRISKEFLQNGIPLLIEKPMTKTVEEADELLCIARDKKCPIQVGHVERFNSAFQAALPYVKNSMFIECHRLGPFKKRAQDVGVVLDLMIHDIDLLLSMIPSPVERIDAVGIHVLTDKEDIANARINFQNGAAANLTASRLTNKTMRKFRIFSENSYISLNTFEQKAERYWKEGEKIRMERVRVKKKEPLQDELASFVQSVSRHETPRVTGEQAREALRIALEIQEKIRQHTRWPKEKILS